MAKLKASKRSKKLTIKIITLFPKFIDEFVGNFGIVKKAIKKKLLEIKPVDLRKFGINKRKTVDDTPYGGGVGMVLRPDVLQKAIESAKKSKVKGKKSKVILLSPQGEPFSQKMAQRLSKYDNLIFVSGRYEGFDERIRKFVDEEISLGDYVLMGGELPALTITEAVIRLRSGILGKDESADKESFSESLLEYPQYTKPEIFNIGKKKLQVPKVLLTGHHKNIEEWRKKEAIKKTKRRRPDLLHI